MAMRPTPFGAKAIDRRAYVIAASHMSPIRYMRFHDALDPLLGSPTKLRLLRTMFGAPDQRWTGRELARTARVSVAQAARELSELADTSLVDREVVGRSYSWQLNRRHVFWPVLADLFHHESSLRSVLVRELSDGLRRAGIERARLFGSIPRGEERDDSDIDLFLEVRAAGGRARAAEAVDRLRSDLWNRYGNPVSALIYSRAEVARPRNPALLKSIEEDGMSVIGVD